MKSLLEIHLLQNFAPSNLNRDDTGSPKDAFFGEYRRARISSQCLKRAAREYFREALPGDGLAVRSRRITDRLVDLLEAKGRPREEAAQIVEGALGGLEIKVKNGESEYLLFLGAREIARVADVINQYWDRLYAGKGARAESGKKRKEAKQEAKSAAPAELARALSDSLDGGKAVDVALFGRMLADLPDKNMDAAAQVAHALSTHKVDREFDFFTAVDDLNPAQETGAGMMGTLEFTSACFYRYAAVGLTQLVDNLQGDVDLALEGVEAFLRASVYAVPAGKQNTFAAHNPPGFIAFTVRKNAMPRNLVGAFEKPVRASGDIGLTDVSVAALGSYWEAMERAYGQPGEIYYLNLSTAPFERGTRVHTVDELVNRTVGAVRKALEA